MIQPGEVVQHHADQIVDDEQGDRRVSFAGSPLDATLVAAVDASARVCRRCLSIDAGRHRGEPRARRRAFGSAGHGQFQGKSARIANAAAGSSRKTVSKKGGKGAVI